MPKRCLERAIILLFPLLGLGPHLPLAAEESDSSTSHREEVERWHAERIERLRSPTGWLSLVGLEWLESGENTLGGPGESVHLPGLAPGAIGSIWVGESSIRLEAAEESGLLHQGEPVASLELHDDTSGKRTDVEIGSLVFYALRRGNRVGIRIKDRESELRKSFEGIERFPFDEDLRIVARLETPDPPRTVLVPDVLGATNEDQVAGIAHFELGGVNETLLLLEDEEDTFFVIFGDPTNGDETYGGGRFLVAERGEKPATVVLDFNRAYDPPCVFTPFATCPLPPKENRLSSPVRAGERTFGDH